MIESEKTLERKLSNKVKDLSGLCIKLLAMHFIGLPDRLCLLPGGVCFFAEIKTTKQKTRKIQNLVHNKLRGLGFKVYVIDSSKIINEILQDYEGKN